MANVKYNTFGKAIAKNDMDSVALKAMFMATSYTPDPDGHQFVSDIVASRASGTSDLALSSFTITINDTDDATDFDVADLVTGTITATTAQVVIYIDTGVESTSELLCALDLLAGSTPTTFSVVSGVLTATVNARGIFSI